MFCVSANKNKGRQLTFTQKYIRAVHKYSYIIFFWRVGCKGGGVASEICQWMLQESHLYSDNDSRLVDHTKQIPCP